MESIRVVDGFVAVIGALIFLTNAINLATLWSYNSREQIFRRSMSYMVANLGVADLLIATNAMLWGLRDVTGFYPLKTFFKIFYVTFQVSFLTILAMAMDRFIAVTYPTDNESIVSPRRTLLCCLFIWVFSTSVGVLISYNLNIGKFVFCALFEVEIVAVVVMYTVMYRKARAISKLAHNGEVSDKNTIRKATLESRLYTVVSLLVGILVATVFPYILALHIELGYSITSRESDQNKTLSKFLDFYFPVELLNFLANPVVYTWRLPNYRRALMKTFSRRC